MKSYLFSSIYTTTFHFLLSVSVTLLFNTQEVQENHSEYQDLSTVQAFPDLSVHWFLCAPSHGKQRWHSLKSNVSVTF